MTEYIEVNGARIDRSFLEENVSEAKDCAWRAAQVPTQDDHVHCIVCDLPMPRGSLGFRCDSRWLCDYCMERFI